MFNVLIRFMDLLLLLLKQRQQRTTLKKAKETAILKERQRSYETLKKALHARRVVRDAIASGKLSDDQFKRSD